MFRQSVTFGAIIAVLTFSACTYNSAPAGPEQHETRSVDVDKTETLRAQLKMPVGELDVRGGAQKLLDADFTYNVAEWKPDLRYNSGGGAADLTLEQHGPTSSSGNNKNHWDLRLNDKVPVDLRVEVGAGESRLNLGTLTLRSLNVEMGVGTLNLDLRGTPTKNYSVRIRGGVGEATVHLPKNVGIEAHATGGIGDISVTGLHKTADGYVNDANDHATVRIRLDIQGGVGSIRLIAE